MKIYRGIRRDGVIEVTVDGRPLSGVRPETPEHGFEWGYEGGGPYLLSMAILSDHFGDPKKVNEYYRPFCESVVARFEETWVLTSAQIDGALQGVVRVDMTFDALLEKLRGGR